MLAVKNLSTFYGKVQALWDVSFEVHEGEIVALVGANGAGKTTLLNTISGIVRRASGTIRFSGRPIEAEQPRDRGAWASPRCLRRGRLFPDMSVRGEPRDGRVSARAWRPREETFERVCGIFPC